MQHFLDLANTLADISGDILRKNYRTLFTAESKPDKSLVTAIDREVEEKLRKLIREIYPEHGIIGEEGDSHQPDAEYVWVIDPIDGTSSFVAGRPLFVTLIALCTTTNSPLAGESNRVSDSVGGIHARRVTSDEQCPSPPSGSFHLPTPPQGGSIKLIPILGLIDQPILNERWVGDCKTASLNGQPIQTRKAASLADCILATTGPHLFSAEGKAFFDSIQAQVKQTIYGGDGYNYALLASGHIDIVIEEGLKPHDYLALIPIIEGAGGMVTKPGDHQIKDLLTARGNPLISII